MHRFRRFLLFALAVASVYIGVSPTAAQLPSDVEGALGFCGTFAGPPRISNEWENAHAVVIARRLNSRRLDERRQMTTFEVVDVLKVPQSGLIEKGALFQQNESRDDSKDEFCFLFGMWPVGEEGIVPSAGEVSWSYPWGFTAARLEFLRSMPPPNPAPSDWTKRRSDFRRLAYCLRFLEFPDEVVASDAFEECNAVSYLEFKKIIRLWPRDRLRMWLASPGAVPSRTELYAVMLGYCGNEQDAEWMRRKILEPAEEYREGINGIMLGYLLLSREEGLKVLESKLKVDAPGEDESASVLWAVDLMWDCGEGRIAKSRLKETMHLLLDGPRLESAIHSLRRWKDWSVQERLMDVYNDYDLPYIKRAVAGYYVASVKDAPKEPRAPIPPHVTRGKELLEQIRKKDVQIVKDAEKSYFGW